jgi:hypothetical protein
MSVQVFEGKGDGPAPHHISSKGHFWRGNNRLEFIEPTAESRQVFNRLVMGTYISLRATVLGCTMHVVENQRLTGRREDEDRFSLWFEEK